MNKIIVTGGAGYIGSHTVVELINQGYKPIIVDDFSNSNPTVIDRLTELTGTTIDFYEGDCTNKSFMDAIFSEHTPMGVIHFAAFKAVGESVEKPLAYYHNNIDSLLVVLELMVKYQINHLVFSSSCTVYGQPDALPVTENSPIKTAESPYGYTKQVAERIIEDSVKANKQLSSIALRYFNPIGAHPTGLIGELPLGAPNNLVPFVTQTAVGLRDSLTVFGDDYNTKDGTCVRDYIHVVDLAKAHVSALNYLKTKENWYEAINVGTGTGSTVLEVIKGFEDVSGVKLNYQIGPRRPGDVEQVYASVENAEKLLQWKANLSLKEALKDSWNWQQGLSNQD
jgi:UDP-glucose 4-epimerase